MTAMTRWIPSVLLLSLLAGPAPASGEEPRALLVFGPGGRAGDGRIAASYVQERLSPKERPDERVSTTGLPIAADEYHLAGAGKAQWCVSGAPALADLGETIGRAREALDMLESARVIEIVDRFEAGAACAGSVLPGAEQAELFLLRGLAHHVDGSESLAKADFARAAGIDPGLEWDTGYPPDPQQAYLLAREDIAKAGAYQFGWSFALTTGAEVYVDGVPLGHSTLHDLAPVPHLVQIKTDEGITSAFLTVEPGVSGVLVDRMGAITAVMAGPIDGMSRTIAASVLDKAAAQWSAQRVVVVNTTWRKAEKEPLVYRYDAKTGHFELLTAMRAVPRHVPPYTDKLRVTFGAGLQLEAHNQMGGQATDTVWLPGLRPTGSLQLRIGPGFTPGLGLDLLWLMTEKEGGSRSFVFMPQLRPGFGYRFRPRHVQTYLGAELIFGLDRSVDPPIRSGIGLVIDADIVPRAISPLFIRLGGASGFYTGAWYLRGGVELGLKL